MKGKTMLAAAKTTKFSVPPEDVWKAIMNMEGWPELFPAGVFVTNLTPRKSLNPAEPGARVSTQYVMDGKKLDMEISVTVVEESKERRTIAFCIHDIWHSTCTYRYIIHPLSSGQGCRVSTSLALVPNDFYGKIYTSLFCKKIKKDASFWLESDLDDIKNFCNHNDNDMDASSATAASSYDTTTVPESRSM